MELMSPAGNIKSLLAAITSQADSVYLGFKKFNARIPADNFTVYNLKKALSYCHKNNKKVYLTLNTDIKSGELKEAVQILSLAEKIGIDGIIIKDPALISVINIFFNNIKIHYSTQNAITDSFGVRFAKSQNAFRVVLARELTLDEIKSACMIDGVECEIFTEGSMCFSISGRCLMSSWVGGKSGNRGLCAAPCRVLWDNKNNKKTYFSMKDLSLLKHLDKLKEINVKALKIEGRLKSPLWVRDITKLYKDALNEPQKINDLLNKYEELKKYSAREIKEGHIFNHDDLIGKNEDWIKYNKDESFIIAESFFIEKNLLKIDFNTDKNLLKIEIIIFEKNFTLEIKLDPTPKKAKLQPLKNIIAFFTQDEIKDNNIDIQISDPELPVSSGFIQKTAKSIIDQLRKIINDEEKLPELPEKISDFIKPKVDILKRKKILGEYPDKIIINQEYIEGLNNLQLPINTIVVPITINVNYKALEKIKEKYKLILSIPPVLYENSAIEINKEVKKLINSGFNDFEANSYTGLEILKSTNCNKYLGVNMPVLNYLSAEYFYKLGINSLYAACESDLSALKALSKFSNGQIEMLVFAKIPLFYSRVNSKDFINNEVFNDRYDTKLECIKENEINLFVPQMPLSFISAALKKELIYFDSLTADLRYFNKPLKILEDIFSNKINFKTSTFNLLRKFT